MKTYISYCIANKALQCLSVLHFSLRNNVSKCELFVTRYTRYMKLYSSPSPPSSPSTKFLAAEIEKPCIDFTKSSQKVSQVNIFPY